ncbi:retron St85 family effector protein [Serratia oryzae]|uniref:retron St85 family effector protein n=1 Tax=Serratia oryzae TaxID=2034155 RepID=UPI0012E17896|nr:retron St85 family effector protein [Serratia oryzae]
MKKKRMTEKQSKDFANLIKNKIFQQSKTDRATIFLCGGDLNNPIFFRNKVKKILETHPKLEILYPEELFDELLYGQGQHSLLSLENILANSVDVIIIIPESPGSFAELGAFVNNEKLRKKMICLQDDKFKLKKSFINYGPIKLLRSENSLSVLRGDLSKLESLDTGRTFYNRMIRSINKIRSNDPVIQSVDNILYAKRFILPCIYLIDGINNIFLYKLFREATDKEDILCKMIVKSVLAGLIKESIIRSTVEGYHITEIGMQYVLDNFNRRALDELRLEMMNFENRSKTTLHYDIMTNAHP